MIIHQRKNIIVEIKLPSGEFLRGIEHLEDYFVSRFWFMFGSSNNNILLYLEILIKNSLFKEEHKALCEISKHDKM